MPTKILVVDDHQIVRAGLKTTLGGQEDLEVVGEAENGEEALRLARRSLPDVVVMDYSMPLMDGAKATRMLKAEFPDLQVLALTVREDKLCLDSMLMAGAIGFLRKDALPAEILHAVRSVSRGESYFSPSVARTLSTAYTELVEQATGPTPQQLSADEVELLRSLANGKSLKELAARFAVSTRALEMRRKKLLSRIGAAHDADLIKYAIKHGFVSVEKPDHPADA